MAFISGKYSASYGGSALGQTEDGFTISFSPHADEIRGDNLGDIVQDGVYRGVSVFISAVFLEYNAAGIQAAMWPWNGTLGEAGTIGRLLTAMDAALVLTAASGTPAASTPASLTLGNAIIAPNTPIDLLFASRLRRVPLRFISLPDSDGTMFTST